MRVAIMGSGSIGGIVGGRLASSGAEVLFIGEESERVKAFSDAATRAGLAVNISKNIHIDVWSKLVAFAAFSAITSLTRLPVRTCATLPETRALVLEAMNEVIAVAKARGILVPSDAPARVLAFAETVDPNWKTSIWRPAR
jgi:2-dehydropantoate 2-reductase